MAQPYGKARSTRDTIPSTRSYGHGSNPALPVKCKARIMA